MLPLGEFVLAREHLEQGLTLYKPEQHRSHAFLYSGYDPGVSCRSYMARALWALGHPNQALQRSHEAVILAQELAHPNSLAHALAFALVLHQLRREGQLAQERAEALITLSHEQGFSFFLAWGTILQGWALAERGQAEKGITQIRQGLAAWQATGAELYVPLFLGALAQAYALGSQVQEGLRVVAEALAQVGKTEERWYEAELHRLRGELTLQQWEVKSEKSKVEEAEAYFNKALEIAQRQQAKSLELRAVMSRARLWQQQGRKGEAHQLLTEIYSWFTEGFDTKDLQEAKVLLEELT